MSRVLDTNAAARRVGLSASRLRKLRQIGGGPVYEKGATRRHRVYYRVEDLDAWVARTRRRLRATCEAAEAGEAGDVSTGA